MSDVDDSKLWIMASDHLSKRVKRKRVCSNCGEKIERTGDGSELAEMGVAWVHFEGSSPFCADLISDEDGK